MALYKQKKNQGSKGGNRLWISIAVLGSSGPIRFIVNEEQLVAAVIDTALKSYAREGRLPVLGSDLNGFLLYCPSVGSDALSSAETIGSVGARNFVLCRKPKSEKMEDNHGRSTKAISRKTTTGILKAWIHKSLNLKISFHSFIHSLMDMVENMCITVF
ncbi:putative ADP-ribosylation factor GTPase-activating protein AGD11-like [Hibiscus syriacus]|uniref:ADP-ribosylation factor GTPase-activating protein AGD11-like n=1 Tax=Hibiscus syriacus TaxID=106335 RepID=A0A6A2W9L5_HIBSY|nr:uncharacterized protein At4g22758-like [Hibiscus syriacus]KAE8654442.1 putative ADP-ribosylation factor GTPase-activating protein AGD11-like [Hibiscus syriacus]